MEKQYRIELFGGLRLRSAGRVIDRFPTQRAAALLAYLACYDRPLPRRQVATTIWDTTEESALVSLRTALSSLRAAIEADSAQPLFLADRLTIRLNPEACSTDALDYEASLLEADQNPESAAKHLQRAFDLYRGDFAAGLNEEPIPAKRERFRKSYHRTAARLAESIKHSDPSHAREAIARAFELSGPCEALETLKVADLTPNLAPPAPMDLAEVLKLVASSQPPPVPGNPRRPLMHFITVITILAAGLWLGSGAAPPAAMSPKRPQSNKSVESTADKPTNRAHKSARASHESQQLDTPSVQKPIGPEIRSTSVPALPENPPSYRQPKESVLPEFAIVDCGLDSNLASELNHIDNKCFAVGGGYDSDGRLWPLNFDRGRVSAVKRREVEGMVAVATDGTNETLFNPPLTRSGPPGRAAHIADKFEFVAQLDGMNVFLTGASIHGRFTGYAQGPGTDFVPCIVESGIPRRVGRTPNVRLNDINEQHVAVGIGHRQGHSFAVRVDLGDRSVDPSTRGHSDLPGLGGRFSGANGINDRGDIVGYSHNRKNLSRPALWRGEAVIELPLPAGWNGQAFSINREGEIVGTADGRAVYWDKDRRFHDLNDRVVDLKGWTLMEARSINDFGWIVGVGKRNGVIRGFVLLPAPKEEMAVLPESPRVNDGGHAWGIIRLKEPAPNSITFNLQSDDKDQAEPHGPVVIEKGHRIGVFFVSTQHGLNTQQLVTIYAVSEIAHLKDTIVLNP